MLFRSDGNSRRNQPPATPLKRKSALKRRQNDKSSENETKTEDSENSDKTEKDSKKTKLNHVEDTQENEPMQMEETQKLEEIDQEINIILGENQPLTGSFGLNTVEKTKDGFIVHRDIELETDVILSICSDIADFNHDELKEYISTENADIEPSQNLEILALEKATEPDLIKKVKDAQRKSPEIEQIIELVNLNKRPTRIELRSKSQFIKSAFNDFELLSVSDGSLYRKFITQTGTTRQLLVVPEEISAEILRQLHHDLAHAKPLRIKELLFKHVFIFDIAKLSKEMACLQCALAAKPTFRKPRKNSVRNSTDRKSTRLNTSHSQQSRMPSSA